MGGATHSECSLPARSKPKASPRGRGSHESSPCVAPPDAGGPLFLWEARPAANTACRPAQSQKLRPGVGAPTKLPVRGAPLCNWHAFSVGGATRGEQLPARSKPKASPRGRAFYESSPCVAPCYAGGTLFLWEARPAANTACRPAQSQKLRPEGGAPTKAARAWRCLMQMSHFSCLVGGATRGECSLPARSRQKLRPGVGAPAKQPVRGASRCSWHAFLVGGATRGECGFLARSKPKTSPRGRGSHEAARAWRRYVQPGLLHQHVAQLQAIAGMQIGQLRPKIFRQVYQHASRARRFGAFQVEAVVADHHQFPRRHGPAVRQM